MSINFKAATLVLAAASLFGAGSANAACDGSIQTGYRGLTTQCYYLPTVSNGRVTGLQKEVVFRGYANPYGGGGAVIGGGGVHHHH